MTETLGTVASILQLVDTALKAREYILDFVHAPQEQQKLLSEMDDLRPLLAELHTRVVGNPSSNVLRQMKRPLADFKTTMEQFTQKLHPGDGPLSKFSKQLKWTLWSKKEAEEYLDKFEQFKSLLNSWLLLDLCDMGRQHHDVVLSCWTMWHQVLLISGMQFQSSNIFPMRGTQKLEDGCLQIHTFKGGDLVQEEHFGATEFVRGLRSSFTSTSNLVASTAGAGKTVLSSMVMDHLTAEFKKENKANMGVACVYLNHKEAEEQTPARLLSGLWRQLVLRRDLGSPAKKLYYEHHEKGTTPSVSEVFDVLCSAIGDYSKVHIIIDAIDEYPEAQRQILLEYLMMMGSTVNMMITSRPHIHPDGCLPNLEALEIRANEDDIRRYVAGQIQKSSWLSKHVQNRVDLREEILSTIAHTVDGMFLLAKLHIESLSKKSTIKRVREALKTLPTDLNDSYDSAMKRIEDQNQEERNIAHSALTWVVNAKRPLTVAELQVALAVEPGTQELDDDNILDIEIILAVCAGLVIVDEQLTVVRLVHYTTQEYFDSIQEEQFPNAQIEITRTLLTFLSFDRSVDRFQYWNDDLPPLVGYSEYCLIHAAGPPEHQLRSMILEFFGLASHWKEARSWKWSSPPWNCLDFPSQPSPLWIAAGANLLETATFLLWEAPVAQHIDGSEIIVASYYGHLRMVQLLVEHGANVNAQGGNYRSALQAASDWGHINIVQLLIEHGANVNAQGGHFGNALQVASYRGHIDIVQLLIEHGANVNAQGGVCWNALQTASSNGYIKIVQLLIEHGANVNAQGGRYMNALQAASSGGHVDIVQLLIEHGANVNAQGGRYMNALQAASSGGHIDIVQLLIEHSANVNAQGGDFGNALQAASCNGHMDIIQLLIEHGASVSAQGRDFGNALQVASCNGNIAIIQLLIEHGANVNTQGGEYGNALQAASSNGHMNTVQLLIEHSADVNAQGGAYGNALQAASSYGHINIVQLLIEHGADVNAQGGEYAGTLQAASFNGHIDIVQLLIGHGANVNAQGKYGSALKAALHREPNDNVELIQRLENIAQLLRDNGAHEEDLDALTDDTSEHEGQSTDVTPHTTWLLTTTNNSNLSPVFANLAPKPSFVRGPSPRSIWLRWAVDPASALRVLLLPPLLALPTHFLLPLLRSYLSLSLQAVGNSFTPFFLPHPTPVPSSVALFPFLRLILSNSLFLALARRAHSPPLPPSPRSTPAHRVGEFSSDFVFHPCSRFSFLGESRGRVFGLRIDSARRWRAVLSWSTVSFLYSAAFFSTAPHSSPMHTRIRASTWGSLSRIRIVPEFAALPIRAAQSRCDRVRLTFMGALRSWGVPGLEPRLPFKQRPSLPVGAILAHAESGGRGPSKCARFTVLGMYMRSGACIGSHCYSHSRFGVGFCSGDIMPSLRS
ncbi:hypothetical protein B0H13DRAFT_2405537 [Mycena leptocephala]|nr:hypothetical protein B0H13DRAFT_2405537 [Mycena leptocephala]